MLSRMLFPSSRSFEAGLFGSRYDIRYNLFDFSMVGMIVFVIAKSNLLCYFVFRLLPTTVFRISRCYPRWYFGVQDGINDFYGVIQEVISEIKMLSEM